MRRGAIGGSGEIGRTARSNAGIVIPVAAFATAMLLYGLILTGGTLHFLKPANYGLTFNSMLVHLLQGRFDVDPAAVGNEGFLRDGRVYSYWGIFCALLRLPLLAWPGAIDIDVTVLSCLAGVAIGAYFKLRSLLVVARHGGPSAARTLLTGAFGAWLLLGGAQTGFLRVTIYQEVLFWAGALAAAFSFVAIRGLLLGRFSTLDLSAMAALAGLALIARVSTGLGLCAAFALLLAVLIRDAATARPAGASGAAGRLRAALLRRSVLIPVGILAALGAVVAVVNAGRWGDPLVFADYRTYLGNRIYPDRVARMEQYGLFNPRRLPIGLIYYFFPVWVLHRADGPLLLAEYRDRLVDALELPPASFLLTDLLPILLVALMLWRTRPARPPTFPRAQALAIGAGLAVPALLMLTAIYMGYRYRMEFYPLLEFAGLLAIARLADRYAGRPIAGGLRAAIIAATVVSIVSANAGLALYRLSPGGPGQMALRTRDIVTLYTSQFGRLPH